MSRNDMITGKCKEDFEKWLYERQKTYKFDYIDVFDIGAIYGYPFSMQYGVYVDFFDSVGIVVTSDYSDIYLSYYSDANIRDSEVYNAHQHKTRAKARTKAIEKANEIYNVK